MKESTSEGLGWHLPQPEPATMTRQAIIVDADQTATFDAIRATGLADSRAVTALARVRMAPDQILRRLRGMAPAPTLKRATLVDLISSGYWIVLEDHPPRELVLGLVMWDETVARQGLTRERFAQLGPGSVRVGWSFSVEPLAGDRSLLVTETRTEPADDAARRKFRLYWTAVAPFAALTRRLALAAIAARAEVTTISNPSQPADSGQRTRVRA
jgi:hypothetical protein